MNPSLTGPEAPVIIGSGRVGGSLAAAARRAGLEVELRDRSHGLDGLGGRVVLLCVPDQEIATLANQIGATPERPGPVGHTSGATEVSALLGAGTAETFSIHPLQTIPDSETDLRGCPAAVAGATAESLEVARQLARLTGMAPFEIDEADRVIYHAAASIASNFLVTIEQTAAGLLGSVSDRDPRELLGPLVRSSLGNWLERGPAALTGPIARGDEATVSAHREALAERRPDLLPFYDANAERTRDLVREAGSG